MRPSALVAGLGLALAGAGFPPVAADEAVTVLAESCAGCHGTDGRSPGAVPSLAGVPEEALLARLAAFKADDDPGATIMPRIAAGYSDGELEALARYFAELEPEEAP